MGSKLINHYNRWLSIVESQLELLCLERQDDRFEQLAELEIEKRMVKLEVMNDEESQQLLDESTKEKLTTIIQALILLNEKADPYIRKWYDEASQDMRQVTTQQRILTTYGGAQNIDIISMYVDSKK